MMSNFLRVMQYVKKHKLQFGIIVMFTIISATANVMGTYSLMPIIDNYIIPRNMEGLGKAIALLIGLYGLGAISTHIYTQVMVVLAQKIIKELRDDVFAKIQKLPISFFDKTPHGDTMSCLTNDVEVLSEALNNSLTNIIYNAIVLVETFVMMLLLNVNLSMIVFVFLMLMFLFIRHSMKNSRKYFKAQQEVMGEFTGLVEEEVSGAKVVKVFNREEENLEAFRKYNERVRTIGVRAASYAGMIIPSVVGISYLNYTISACIGGLFVMKGLIGAGQLAAYLIYVRQIALPVNQFANQLNAMLSGLAGAGRIFAIIDTPKEVDDGRFVIIEKADGTQIWENKDTKEQKPLNGKILLEDVSFGYNSERIILKNVNMHAKLGEKIAFVGSTGAGKTTIANLLNRFYDIQEGKILYDGIDIRDIRKDDLRHSMSVVLQDTHLFTGTIKENIKYGKMEASTEEVIAAAKLSNADSFIRRLPKGYETMLNHDGGNLSQGQRQLLAIARAAIANPTVLILDEATSSIDTYTEKLIESGMDRLMQGRTVFVIAHRLSTVRNADAILVLDQGEIIERGGHKDLVEQRGVYYQLYTGQFELS